MKAIKLKQKKQHTDAILDNRRARPRLGMRGSIMVRFPTSGS